jgi:hypothetical protein
MSPAKGSTGSGLGPLCPVLRPSLPATVDTRSVERAANDVIPNTWKVLNPTATDHYDRMLLEVVPFARDVRGNLEPVRQTHARNLTERRVRLLRSGGIHTSTHPSTLRTLLQCRARGLGGYPLSPLPYQLVDCRQTSLFNRSGLIPAYKAQGAPDPLPGCQEPIQGPFGGR